jgi:phosphoserine phosphatase
MLELKEYLEAHGFEIWIVTGSEQDFVRALYQEVFGIDPARVIGTWTTPIYSVVEGKPQLHRGKVRVYNGHEHKPENIFVRIGHRPIFAAGNSDNDEPMCLYAVTGAHRGLAIWIQHDDAEREYARRGHPDKIAALCRQNPAAIAVSMKSDWARVFP